MQQEQKLLTSEEAAGLLRKTPVAFRDAMCRSRAGWAIWLASRRVWLGRRYHLRREDVEAILDLGDQVADRDRHTGTVSPMPAQSALNRVSGSN
ncbi:MAG: hypothetical protein B7Z70_15180 [Acidithiobacillus ferrivorans]|uniref:Uncharacterized protein n=1 Tax=Acidithiobacillus ferrivorans TaxID=160808 RepID=A0A257SGF1_9PROT|nr:MAG: hypothetical protein B7Z70_15180 [Acidithiobacillus ferrivorans]